MKSITVRHLNKLMSLMLCTILVGLLFVGAWAQTEAHCQLMIDYRYENMAVSEASFRIYPIANFNDEQELEYTAAFSDLQLDKDALVDAAELLYARIEERGLLPEQIVTTDHQGKASFSNVPAGVFLLVCEPTEMDGFVYHVENQVIFLREDITLCPKSTKLPAGEQMPEKRVPATPDLPTVSMGTIEAPQDQSYRVMPEVVIDGIPYIGYLSIPALDLELPVVGTCTEENLEISPCRFFGTVYSENFVIGGHRYRRHFRKLSTLGYGQRLSFTDREGNVYTYELAECEVLEPNQAEYLCSGDWDLSLFTCTPGGLTRVVLRCLRVEVK